MRKGKPNGGGRLGYCWSLLEIGKRVKYPGSYTGAKSHVWRLNHTNRWERKFRTYRKGDSVYVERVS